MDATEIKSIKSDLEKAVSDSQIISILQVLQKQLKPSEKILRETKIGVAVNKYRTHENPTVSSLVKKIIRSWKDQVQREKDIHRHQHKKSSPSSDHTNQPSTTNLQQQHRRSSASTTNNNSTHSNSNNATNKTSTTTTTATNRSATKDGVRTSIYDNTTRNGSLKVLYDALVQDTTASPSQVFETAKGIEVIVYQKEGGVKPGYRNKMRSLVMNIKQKNNPELRSKLLRGEITPQRLYTMKAQEMAPEGLKKEIEELEKMNLFKAQGATEQRAVTDRFTCGKCKQKKVSYYQMQTRSADEPLTTFCTCENCGNRWKFS